MGFFQEEVDSEVTGWAMKLRAALHAKKMQGSNNVGTTVAAFRNLKKKQPAARISAVLDWYCLHLGEEFVPRITTGTAFGKRFDDVVRAMNRDPESEEVFVDLVSIEVATHWERTANWPVEVRPHLALIVQQSRKNWGIFRDKMKETKVESGFIHQVIIAHPKFIDEWIEQLNRELSWKEHYNGDVLQLAFRADSKRFKDSFWRAWSYQWCGNSKRYDSLLADLLKG